jgi:hypothetical protein
LTNYTVPLVVRSSELVVLFLATVVVEKLDDQVYVSDEHSAATVAVETKVVERDAVSGWGPSPNECPREWANREREIEKTTMTNTKTSTSNERARQ